MIRSFRAEILKLARPSIRYGALGSIGLLALLATVLTFLTAKTDPATSFAGAPSLASSLAALAEPAGLTRGFTLAAGLLGLVVFVLFLTSMTSEYSQGTIRSLLTRQPHRVRLLAGKLAALLALTALALLAAEILAGAASIGLALVRGIPTSNWFTTDGLTTAAGAYANALLSATFFGAAGMALGVLARSTPLALGLGIAWLGPLEHITQLSWSDAERWFPGLIFDTVAAGGTPDDPYQRALLLAVGFTTVAVVAGTISIARRDVTA